MLVAPLFALAISAQQIAYGFDAVQSRPLIFSTALTRRMSRMIRDNRLMALRVCLTSAVRENKLYEAMLQNRTPFVIVMTQALHACEEQKGEVLVEFGRSYGSVFAEQYFIKVFAPDLAKQIEKEARTAAGH